MPLALVHYGMRRLALPLFLGKFVHNVLLALLFYGFASWSADHVSEQASTDLALAVAVLFMLLVGYHAEKARARLGPSAAAGQRTRWPSSPSHRPEPCRQVPGARRAHRSDRGSNCS